MTTETLRKAAQEARIEADRIRVWDDGALAHRQAAIHEAVAAWYAAGAAAWYAARDAAGDALAPTVATLQTSALDLLDRMNDGRWES